MKTTGNKLFLFVCCPITLFTSFLWLGITHRLLGLCLLVVFLLLYLTLYWHRKIILLPVIWLLFIASTFLPVDLSFQNYPGPPQFVPLVMGLPALETIEKARRGECMLGGCTGSGFEPKWVWVW
jgi:hypothetical protein